MNDMVKVEPPASLLLLPEASFSITSLSSLESFYGAPIRSALLATSDSENLSSDATLLDIALPITSPQFSELLQLASSFDNIQQQLAGIYKLVSILCSREKIEIHGRGGVDVSIIPIVISDPSTSTGDRDEILQGPIVELSALAQSHQRWTHIYAVDGEEGHLVLTQFLSAAASGQQTAAITKVSRGERCSDDAPILSLSEEKVFKYEAVAAGGTFDHLHAGHKLLLTMTAFLIKPPTTRTNGARREITIGITGDKLLENKKFSQYLQTWETRAHIVSNFLRRIIEYTPANASSKISEYCEDAEAHKLLRIKLQHGLEIELVELQDPFGPTISHERIEALVVSGETKDGGKAINDKRREKEWKELSIYEIDVLSTAEEELPDAESKQSFQGKISSTEFRRLKSEKQL